MKRLAIITTTVFVILTFSTALSQNALDKIQDKLLRDANTNGYFFSNNRPTEFYKTFALLRKEFHEANKWKGKLGFGFNGNSTKNQELFKLNTGIAIEKGKYPYQISFKSQLNIQIQNGKLQENLSNLQISYDRFFNYKKDPIAHEWYVFMNRTSNQFMGVNQRYEAGIGYVISFWKKDNKVDGDSQTTITALNNKINETPTKKVSFCNQTMCTNSTSLKKSELKTIIKAKESVIQHLRIKETRVRFAMLAGLFYEAESMSFSDSVLTSTGTVLLKHDFAAMNNFRMEFRPTIDFSLSYLSLKIRPYFKLPLSTDWFVERDGRSVYDMRFELPISLSIKISDGFSMGLEYTLFHDQAPNSFLKTDVVATDGQPIYLTTSRNNHVTSLVVSYTF